jgi:EmrB/QacA subfamily drug resistance transporter
VTTSHATPVEFHAEDLPYRTKMFILASVMLGLFLSSLDQTIVSTAMPAIIRDLRGLEFVAWTSTAYLLASTTMVPIYGKLSDHYGRRIILLFGIVVFLIGSALCGLATDIYQLIGFRVVQGIGAAGLTSTAFAIPADLFSPAERPKYMGIFGAVFGVSSIIGPLMGGYLTDTLSWHWVFYVNLPVGVVAIAFIMRYMPSLSRHLQAKIDWLGSITMMLGVVPLLLGLTIDKELHPWDSPLVIGFFAMAALFITLFLMVEQRAESPILRLALFKEKTFSVTMFSSLLNGAAFFGAFLFLSLFMVNVLGVTATEAGSAQIPLMLSFVVGSVVSSQLVSRTGRYKPFILVGFAVMLIGFYLMTQLSVTSTSTDVVWRMIILGIGLGPTLPLLNLAMQNAVPYQYLGTAVANRQFFQQLGQAIGAALFGVVLTTTLTAQINRELQPIMAQLPPSLHAQLNFTGSSLRNSVTAGTENSEGPTERILAAVDSQFVALNDDIVAVANGDEAMRTKLLANPQLPVLLRTVIERGTITPQTLPALQTELETMHQATRIQASQVGTQIEGAMKRAFTTSITQIYFDAIWLVLISFTLILFLLDEIPLRKSNRDVAPVTE